MPPRDAHLSEIMGARKNVSPQRLGIIERQRLARTLEKRLLKLVNESPGISVYELSRKTARYPSTVHSAIQRLARGKELVTRTIIRKEGRIKRVYPPSFEFPEPSIVTIPKQVVDVSETIWQQAHIYRLNAESIGIAGSPVPEWEEVTASISEKILHGKESLEIRLPAEICSFYGLDNKETMLAFFNNKALLTITGSVE